MDERLEKATDRIMDGMDFSQVFAAARRSTIKSKRLVDNEVTSLRPRLLTSRTLWERTETSFQEILKYGEGDGESSAPPVLTIQVPSTPGSDRSDDGAEDGEVDEQGGGSDERNEKRTGEGLEVAGGASESDEEEKEEEEDNPEEEPACVDHLGVACESQEQVAATHQALHKPHSAPSSKQPDQQVQEKQQRQQQLQQDSTALPVTPTPTPTRTAPTPMAPAPAPPQPRAAHSASSPRPKASHRPPWKPALNPVTSGSKQKDNMDEVSKPPSTSPTAPSPDSSPKTPSPPANKAASSTNRPVPNLLALSAPPNDSPTQPTPTSTTQPMRSPRKMAMQTGRALLSDQRASAEGSVHVPLVLRASAPSPEPPPGPGTMPPLLSSGPPTPSVQVLARHRPSSAVHLRPSPFTIQSATKWSFPKQDWDRTAQATASHISLEIHASGKGSSNPDATSTAAAAAAVPAPAVAAADTAADTAALHAADVGSHAGSADTVERAVGGSCCMTQEGATAKDVNDAHVCSTDVHLGSTDAFGGSTDLHGNRTDVHVGSTDAHVGSTDVHGGNSSYDSLTSAFTMCAEATQHHTLSLPLPTLHETVSFKGGQHPTAPGSNLDKQHQVLDEPSPGEPTASSYPRRPRSSRASASGPQQGAADLHEPAQLDTITDPDGALPKPSLPADRQTAHSGAPKPSPLPMRRSTRHSVPDSGPKPDQGQPSDAPLLQPSACSPRLVERSSYSPLEPSLRSPRLSGRTFYPQSGQSPENENGASPSTLITRVLDPAVCLHEEAVGSKHGMVQAANRSADVGPSWNLGRRMSEPAGKGPRPCHGSSTADQLEAGTAVKHSALPIRGSFPMYSRGQLLGSNTQPAQSRLAHTGLRPSSATVSDPYSPRTHTPASPPQGLAAHTTLWPSSASGARSPRTSSASSSHTPLRPTSSTTASQRPAQAPEATAPTAPYHIPQHHGAAESTTNFRSALYATSNNHKSALSNAVMLTLDGSYAAMGVSTQEGGAERAKYDRQQVEMAKLIKRKPRHSAGTYWN